MTGRVWLPLLCVAATAAVGSQNVSPARDSLELVSAQFSSAASIGAAVEALGGLVTAQRRTTTAFSHPSLGALLAEHKARHEQSKTTEWCIRDALGSAEPMSLEERSGRATALLVRLWAWRMLIVLPSEHSPQSFAQAVAEAQGSVVAGLAALPVVMTQVEPSEIVPVDAALVRPFMVPSYVFQSPSGRLSPLEQGLDQAFVSRPLARRQSPRRTLLQALARHPTSPAAAFFVALMHGVISIPSYRGSEFLTEFAVIESPHHQAAPRKTRLSFARGLLGVLDDVMGWVSGESSEEGSRLTSLPPWTGPGHAPNHGMRFLLQDRSVSVRNVIPPFQELNVSASDDYNEAFSEWLASEHQGWGGCLAARGARLEMALRWATQCVTMGLDMCSLSAVDPSWPEWLGCTAARVQALSRLVASDLLWRVRSMAQQQHPSDPQDQAERAVQLFHLPPIIQNSQGSLFLSSESQALRRMLLLRSAVDVRLLGEPMEQTVAAVVKGWDVDASNVSVEAGLNESLWWYQANASRTLDHVRTSSALHELFLFCTDETATYRRFLSVCSGGIDAFQRTWWVPLVPALETAAIPRCSAPLHSSASAVFSHVAAMVHPSRFLACAGRHGPRPAPLSQLGLGAVVLVAVVVMSKLAKQFQLSLEEAALM
jgi:hypothetical protein